MRKYVFLALICFCTVHAFAQKIVISGKNGNRKLEWADFTGKPDANSTFFAHTWYTLKYSYNNVVTNGDQATIDGFEAILELDPNKSWVRTDKTSDELLEHEQGHFNIGIMCMRELLTTVNGTSFSKSDYAEALRNIFREVMRKYNDMNVQYDNETEHFKNKEQQQKWNAVFAEKLELEKKQKKAE